jgi:hypothetical protein
MQFVCLGMKQACICVMRGKHPTREERQAILMRLAEMALRRDPGLSLTHWLADCEIAYSAARERLAGDCRDAWREECGRLERED